MTNKNRNGRWIAGGALAVGVLGLGAVRIVSAQSASAQTTDGTGGAAGTAATATSTSSPGSAGGDIKVYVAQLFGANGTGATGTARFVIDGDQFQATVDGQGLDPGIKHAMHIHAGATCPTLADDKNGDGFVDAQEGAAADGGILIPLDGDLNSQNAGQNFTPTASADGTVFFAGSGRYSTMQQDLRGNGAISPATGLTRLRDGEDLALETRTVEIHGINQTLPNTVAGLDGLKNNEALTVACGTIVQISGAAGTATPSSTASGGATLTETATATATPTPTASGGAAGGGTATPTETATATATPTTTASGGAAATESPTATPSAGETATATATPEAGASPTEPPSPGETASPSPSPSPSQSFASGSTNSTTTASGG